MMRIVQAAKQYVYLKSIESQLDIALRIAKSGPDKLNTLKSHARKKKSCLVLTLLYCHSKVTTLKEKKKSNYIQVRSRENITAAGKSLQSSLTLCDPIDGSPPGFPIPGILQARTLEWVAISFSYLS